MKKQMQCYMCNAVATTKEHVPPRSFFPKSHRQRLITVPSCEIHNNSNAKDVEYARNLIAMNRSSNTVGGSLFHSKGIASFKRSPDLLRRTFNGKRILKIDDKKTLALKIEKARYENVMQSIAHGLYFNDFNETFKGTWLVINDTLAFDMDASPTDMYEFHEFIKLGLSYKKFKERSTDNPDVFKYFYNKTEFGDLIYKIILYGDFIAYLTSAGSPLDILGIAEIIEMNKES